jgi:DNA-directed RNA polymerase specialized sigma24 family protein
MPAERTTMRQVREVLRLRFVGGVSTREIARRIAESSGATRSFLARRARNTVRVDPGV